ncbi:13721_t:CDS:2, partial [Dentiscutata erythropus]
IGRFFTASVEEAQIVTSEIRQEIINSIANPDIPKKHIPCEVKRKCKARKKLIFNNTASESSFTSESGSDSESDIEISEYVSK